VVVWCSEIKGGVGFYNGKDTVTDSQGGWEDDCHVTCHVSVGPGW